MYIFYNVQLYIGTYIFFYRADVLILDASGFIVISLIFLFDKEDFWFFEKGDAPLIWLISLFIHETWALADGSLT